MCICTYQFCVQIAIFMEMLNNDNKIININYFRDKNMELQYLLKKVL